jgi:uncharacterized metal-binding protein
MHGDFPAFEDLYGDSGSRRMAYHAARIEAEGYCRWPRLREIAQFAARMDMNRLGIAYCPDMAREARLAARYLRSRSLEAVVPEPTADCRPGSQARDLAEAGTDLNLLVGMCVGHDAVFTRASSAPVTSLVSRDLRLHHNPAAALYLRRSYLRDALRSERGEAPTAMLRGWDDETLEGAASETRASGTERRSRLEEIMDFARRLGASHLGIVFCVGLRGEARELNEVLQSGGFRVSSVCCKAGAVPKEQLGIRDGEKVRPGLPEMICNPLAQSELLNREAVDLVLLVGQCVGHDSATIQSLDAPAVVFVTKDRVLAHNSVAALYETGEGPQP